LKGKSVLDWKNVNTLKFKHIKHENSFTDFANKGNVLTKYSVINAP